MSARLTYWELFDERPGQWSERAQQTREMARLLETAYQNLQNPHAALDEKWRRDVRAALGMEEP